VRVRIDDELMHTKDEDEIEVCRINAIIEGILSPSSALNCFLHTNKTLISAGVLMTSNICRIILHLRLFCRTYIVL
jgi:hypothetical protein